MESILEIIIHVLKFIEKNLEFFTLKPNAHGTFRNLHIKINIKFNISDTNGTIKLEFCMLFPVHRCGASGSMRACHAAGPGSIPGRDRFPM